MSAEIAARVRAERAHRRWTLDDLAARSAISRRLLVQIEHAEANPSLATLLKLAAALEITLTELLSQDAEAAPVAVVSDEDALTLWSTPAGSTARLLVSHGPLELWTWTLIPGDQRSSEPHRPGSLELLSVQTGTIELDVGNHQVEVHTATAPGSMPPDPTLTSTRERTSRRSRSSCSNRRDRSLTPIGAFA